jgi:hypothetical protein
VTSKVIHIIGTEPGRVIANSFSWNGQGMGDPCGGSLIGFDVDGALLGNIVSDHFVVRSCFIRGSATIHVLQGSYAGVLLDSSIFLGPVSASGSADNDTPFQSAGVLDCDFAADVSIPRGFGSTTISGSVFHGNASAWATAYQNTSVVSNTFLGAGRINVSSNDGSVSVLENVLSGGVINAYVQMWSATVSRNFGARTINVINGNMYGCTIEDNVVRAGDGIEATSTSARIRRNVVIGCSRGIVAWAEVTHQNGTIANNTVYGCTGVGIEVRNPGQIQLRVDNNIVYGNGIGIVFNDPVEERLASCNDVADNSGGDWIGGSFEGVDGNFALDPLFCDPDDEVLTLAANSPCLPPNGACGLVGALGEGCSSMGACCQPDNTCTLTTEDNCPSPSSWAGAGTVCVPNRCLPGACCLIRYCLVMGYSECVGYGGVHMGGETSCDPNPCVSAIEDESPIASLDLSVTPNPSSGQVMVRYTLPRPTTVRIEVFDAAGGVVGRIVEGDRPAGAYSTPWNGRNENGRELPTGVYFARIVTAEGMRTGRMIVAR